MLELIGHFDGKAFVPDEPLGLKPNQRVRMQVEVIEQPQGKPGGKRQLGLQRGSVLFIAADFDAELADGFWLGEDQ